MPERPIIFIASSSEQLRTAQRIHEGLKYRDWDVRVWDTQFAFSAAYVESLEKALDRADFAVVVMTGDDAANVRKDAVVLPRDNVIFELVFLTDSQSVGREFDPCTAYQRSRG